MLLVDDIQRPIKQSFCGSLRRDTHWKCLILSVLIYSCLSTIGWCRFSVIRDVTSQNINALIIRDYGTSPCNDGYIYIPVAFVIMLYLVYLVECWHCHTRIELQHKVDVSTVYERVQIVREAMPIIWWKAICYHYVRRTRQITRYRNGDAFTTTQVYYERINTHTAGTTFNFTMCGLKDLSKYLVGLEVYPATKIKFSKGFSFINWASENEFERQRTHFFRDNERRDDYMETREGMDLLNVNFKEYIIAFADADNQPWYVSHCIFWVISLLLLSWPLRVFIEYKTAYVHYHVHKQFGGNYDSNNHTTTAMGRSATIDYNDIEMAIFSNYAIVPSYSQALLMGDHMLVSDNAIYSDANANIFRSTRRSPRSVSFNNFVVVNKNTLADDNVSQTHPNQTGHFTNNRSVDTDLNCVETGTVPGEENTNISETASIINHARKSKRKRKKWRQFMSTPDFSTVIPQSNSVISFHNASTLYYNATTTRTNRFRRNSITDEYEPIPLHEPTFIERIRRFPSSFSWASLSGSQPTDQPPCYEDAVRLQRLNSLTSRATLEEREPLTIEDSRARQTSYLLTNYTSLGFKETSL